MTAYLSPVELDLTQQEFDGLVALKARFESRPPIQVSNEDALSVFSLTSVRLVFEERLGFTMRVGAGVVVDGINTYDCGCVACLGGHLFLAMDGVDPEGRCFTRQQLRDADHYVSLKRHHRALGPLFYPPGIRDWDLITSVLAAEAIGNVLTTSSADWRSICEREGIPYDTAFEN